MLGGQSMILGFISLSTEHSMDALFNGLQRVASDASFIFKNNKQLLFKRINNLLTNLSQQELNKKLIQPEHTFPSILLCEKQLKMQQLPVTQ